ncbi:MAG: YkvA family protein [Bacteroidota bacterium]
MKGFFRMIAALLSRRYSAVPWRSLILCIILVLYAVSPIDLIPDYIPFIGVIDDLTLLGFFIRSVMKDVKRFNEWDARTK